MRAIALWQKLEESRLEIFREIDLMTPEQLNDWYERVVGYRPQVDDPKMSDAELRRLVERYVIDN